MTIFVYHSQLSGITATEGVESETNHHPLLIRILADEMNVKRKYTCTCPYFLFILNPSFSKPNPRF